MASYLYSGTASSVLSQAQQDVWDFIRDPDQAYDANLTGVNAASEITMIEAGNGNGTINGSAITAINGTAAAVVQALTDLDTDPTNFNSTVTGDISVATANSLDALTSGVVTATITETDAATLATLTGTGNAYTITVTGPATAAGLNTINAATTVQVNAAGVTAITGSAGAVAAVYAGISGFSGLGDEAVGLESGTAAAADLVAINAATSGTVAALHINTITGTAADVVAVYAGISGFSGLGDEAVTLSGATMSAADLITIIAATTGTISVANVDALTGTTSDLVTVYNSLRISDFGDVPITVTNASAQANDLVAVTYMTTGVVDASAVTALTGNANWLAQAYSNVDITGLGEEAVTLSSGSAGAANLVTINTENDGAINAAAVGTIQGTAADVAAVYAGISGFSGLGNEAVTVYDSAPAASNLVAIDAATSGLISLPNVSSLTGSAADVAAVYASSGITGLGGAVVVSLTGSTAAASDLVAVNAATSVTIDASLVTTITGTAVDVAAVYAGIAGFSGLGGEAVTLSDTSVAAATLNALNAETSGVITFSNVTTITGSAADVATAYAAFNAGEITGLGSAAVTVSAGSAAALDLDTINDLTSGTINATDVTTITGTAEEVAAVYAGISGFTGLGNEAVTLDDTPAAAADLLAIDTATSSTITASALTSINGSAADVAAVYTASGITGLGGAVAVSLTGATAAAAELNAIDTATSITIFAPSITTITGAASDVLTVYDSNGFSDLSEANITLSSTASVSDLAEIEADTSGTITVTGVSLRDTAANALAGAAQSWSFDFSTLNVVLTDTEVTASTLVQLYNAFSETIDATSVTTLTGDAADFLTLVAASGRLYVQATSTTVTGGISVETANSLDDLTLGVVTATITETDAATLATLSGTDNAYTVTVTGPATAAELNAIDDATTVQVAATGVT
ncbi:hypothetical protein, partial [Novosphingobium sp. AAP83]|uniref:beta strand repeat-containing protein n=1 Tax=Novosphingobium sp. AAP83 TaxID=1523425 RepID=UPI000ADE9D47